TIPSGGGKARRLRTQVSSFCTEPTWNPVDSGKIAFTAATGGGFQIALYDTSDGRARVLTSVRGSAVEPAWLNDGRHLVFTQREGGSTRLVLLDSESGKMTPLHRPSFGSASSASFVY
ncbi:MAG: TolB family protein, partial [Opitutales bacterium]